MDGFAPALETGVNGRVRVFVADERLRRRDVRFAAAALRLPVVLKTFLGRLPVFMNDDAEFFAERVQSRCDLIRLKLPAAQSFS